jgi:CRP-like cAMP-binding protein
MPQWLAGAFPADIIRRLLHSKMKTKISTINLLDELKAPKYEQLCNDFTTVKYRKGQLIYAPGQDRDLVLIIKEGKVRVYLAMEDKEFSLALLEPGDLYTSHTRAHVSAVEDVTLLTMATGQFHRYMVTSPALSRTIVSILGELLKQSFSIIDNLVFKDISSRLTEFFLHEAEHNGHLTEEGILLKLDLTMEQLAAIVGSSRQTVSTIINSMQRAEVLQKKERGVFLIPNRHLLKNFPAI